MLKRINTQDQDLALVQDNVSAALAPLENQPMFGGTFINGISLIAAQDNLIEHGLGRVPVIFFIGNLNENTAVWTEATSLLNGLSSNNKYINLQCSTTCTIALWVN